MSVYQLLSAIWTLICSQCNPALKKLLPVSLYAAGIASAISLCSLSCPTNLLYLQILAPNYSS